MIYLFAVTLLRLTSREKKREINDSRRTIIGYTVNWDTHPADYLIDETLRLLDLRVAAADRSKAECHRARYSHSVVRLYAEFSCELGALHDQMITSRYREMLSP